MKQSTRQCVAPANPRLWSEKSQRSVSASWTKEYRDIPYQCWRCQAEAVFTAQDQKYTFEVLKAPIDQRRTLCEDCWRESLTIDQDLKKFEVHWRAEKSVLRKDREFLAGWLRLLETREEYVAYKPDTAKKNMLKKLLADV
jgi:hypothetical protein